MGQGRGYLLKRFMDVMVSGLLLLVLSPVMLIIYLLLKSTEGNAFFIQRRAGLMGKSFVLLKFRTMNANRDSNGKLLPDAERMTRLGSLLRKSSLDELPQLINVLKGEMSLVGPRPLLTDYLQLYTERQQQRHCVKPGITGWAQVNGRNNISWEAKFELDVWYVEHCSLKTDLNIMLRTVMVVFRAKGIHQAHGIALGRFTGTPNTSLQ